MNTSRENTYADCELAWTNLEKAVRRKVHQWHGMLRKGGEDRHHPTQKPLEVIQWAIMQAGDVQTILDPWAERVGSSVWLAPLAAKLHFMGLPEQTNLFNKKVFALDLSRANMVMSVAADATQSAL